MAQRTSSVRMFHQMNRINNQMVRRSVMAMPQFRQFSFSVGDINVVQSAPDNEPPIKEDTIEGRYAAVLFSSASQENSLYDIYEDIMYLQELYKECEAFHLFTQNAGVGSKEIGELNEILNQLGDFNPLTIKFLEILAENKRLTFLNDIASRYQKLY